MECVREQDGSALAGPRPIVVIANQTEYPSWLSADKDRDIANWGVPESVAG